MEMRDDNILLVSSNQERDELTKLEAFIEEHLEKLCKEVVDKINGKPVNPDGLLAMIAHSFHMHYGVSNVHPIVEGMVKYAAMQRVIKGV